MRKVYVVGAYVRNGGTYMAYHLGEVLAQYYGYSPVAVQVGDEGAIDSPFLYQVQRPVCSMEDLFARADPDDLVVVNPSFSHLMAGLRVPSRKICYVQGFNTFPVLDGFHDLYVSVSSPVAEYLRNIYRIETAIIPAFIETALVPQAPPWEERLDRILVFRKGGYAWRPLLEELLERYELRYAPGLRERIDSVPPNTAHAELLEMMTRYRYCLSLSPCEGFGLLPLEAMYSSAAVVGFDAVGGRDYFADGHNALVTSYPDLDGLVERINDMLGDSDRSRCLGEAARRTASGYSKERFYGEWKNLLSGFLHATI